MRTRRKRTRIPLNDIIHYDYNGQEHIFFTRQTRSKIGAWYRIVKVGNNRRLLNYINKLKKSKTTN